MSSEIPAKALKESIKKMLLGADLTKLTSRKVRTSLQVKFETDFTDRKKEIDTMLMKLAEEAVKEEEESESAESSESEDSSSSESDFEANQKKSRAVKSSTKTPASRKRPSTNSKSASKSKKSKDETDSKEEKVKKKTGFGREMVLSAELAELVGTEKLSRGDVVKKMYAVIKERDLYDQTNRQYVICDEELLKIFGVKRFRAFGMMKYLKKHIKDPKDIV